LDSNLRGVSGAKVIEATPDITYALELFISLVKAEKVIRVVTHPPVRVKMSQ
jgi:hypothetical protein